MWRYCTNIFYHSISIFLRFSRPCETFDSSNLLFGLWGDFSVYVLRPDGVFDYGSIDTDIGPESVTDTVVTEPIINGNGFDGWSNTVEVILNIHNCRYHSKGVCRPLALSTPSADIIMGIIHTSLRSRTSQGCPFRSLTIPSSMLPTGRPYRGAKKG